MIFKHTSKYISREHSLIQLESNNFLEYFKQDIVVIFKMEQCKNR